jgi:hypothetical protein
VGYQAVLEKKREEGNVLGLTGYVAHACGRDGARLCQDYIAHDREVVDGQIPKNVYVVLEEPEIHSN